MLGKKTRELSESELLNRDYYQEDLPKKLGKTIFLIGN